MVPRKRSGFSFHCWIATSALLISSCSGDGPLLSNPAEVDPVVDSNFDQFWAIPLGRAGYPALSDAQSPPGPNLFPGGSQSGSPGGAAFYPGPIPGSVQVGYFSGPPSYPPGNYGFNGNGVFGFSIPANALVQQQQQSNNHPWGSGFWSRFNPVNRVGNFFNFPQRQPVHQYAFSASITNQNNRQPTLNSPPQPPSGNSPIMAAPHPYYQPPYYQQSQNWYNGGNVVPFGNPYFYPPNQPFSNNNAAFQQQNSDPSHNNADKNPSYNRPSIPVYNPPSSIPDNSDSQNNSTESSSTFTPNQPIRSDNGRPGLWGENLRRNWLHVPWIGNWGNRDVSPRTDYPGATLFSLQG